MFIYNDQALGFVKLEFQKINLYGNYNFTKTWKTDPDINIWVWRPEHLHYLIPEKVYNSKLYKALK